jgi:hypothetical protein
LLEEFGRLVDVADHGDAMREGRRKMGRGCWAKKGDADFAVAWLSGTRSSERLQAPPDLDLGAAVGRLVIAARLRLVLLLDPAAGERGC